MSRIAAVLVGSLLFMLAIAVFTPASIVDAEVAARSSGALRVAQAQGTLWSGRGVLVAGDGSWRLPLAWRIAPLQLARGVVDLTIAPMNSADDAPRGRLQLESDGVRLEGIVLRLPARALAGLANNPSVQAGGEVEVRSDALALAREGGTGDAVAQWTHARLRVPGSAVFDLGTVDVRWAVRGNEVRGNVASRGGQVGVSGEVALRAGAQSVNLEFASDRSAPPAVRAALAALGPPDAQGKVRLQASRDAR